MGLLSRSRWLKVKDVEPAVTDTKPQVRSVGFWVALGSGAGGGARFLVSAVAIALPGANEFLAVVGINAAGSFAVGLVAALTAPGGRWRLPQAARQGLMAGLCGGFTTFSLFSLQTLELLQEDRWAAAIGYAMVTVVLSLAAVWFGYKAGKQGAGTQPKEMPTKS